MDKAKLDEFRATNVALLKERDELRLRFEGIDPDEVRQLKEAHQKAEEDKLLRAGAPRKFVQGQNDSPAQLF